MTNSRRRFLSRNLLRKAIEILKAVVNKQLGSMELIEIELVKAHLYKALRCKDHDSDSIFFLANVHLAVLYYATGHYQTAIDHCTLVTRSADHAECDSHVVQGELLLKIDDDVDNVLGLAVFYQNVRRAMLNQQQTQHVSIFTTEVFAHYLRLKCHFASNVADNISVNFLSDFRHCAKRYLASDSANGLAISDVLLLKTVLKGLRQFENVGSHCEDNSFQENSETGSQDTSELVELLQRCAVELLTSFRHRQRQDFGPHLMPATNDFEALYAFHRGQYRHCIRICKDIVDQVLGPKSSVVRLMMYPEFMQFMDDDIVSLFGLVLLLEPKLREYENKQALYEMVAVGQLPLVLYLLAQSQMKLDYCPVALFDTNLCVRMRRAITEQCRPDCVWELLVLKLTERRIMMHRQMCISQRKAVSEYDRQSVDEFAEAAKALAVARNRSA